MADTIKRKSLPSDVTIPEKSILFKEDYEKMYWVVSQEEEYKRIQKLAQSNEQLDELFEETKYQPLIDVGLAVRSSGAGNPYICLTSLGKVFVNLTPQEGIRKLVNEE